MTTAIRVTILMSLLGTLGACAQTTHPGVVTIQQTDQRVVLVELFTSEGCSSCPPADELLRQINGKETGAGEHIIGISEHVTYWNYLGWSDPFSSKVFSERQYAYAQRFHLSSVYTPQMVIDGEKQIVGSDGAGLLQALRKEQAPEPILIHIDAVAVHNQELTFKYSATGNIPEDGVDLFAVVVDDTDKSNVSRGENSGHVLAHVSVARLLIQIADVRSPTEQAERIALPDLKSTSTLPKRHLILFAQEKGMGRILGVDSIPL